MLAYDESGLCRVSCKVPSPRANLAISKQGLVKEDPLQPTHLKYRPDIDGLRAVAVLLVVAFHAFPNLITGGFVGVDVFFVISGYLISSIIVANLNRGTFSFIDFYCRRVKRIFPAVILVLVISLAFGWFVLLPLEYKQLAKHVTGGSAFLSNIILWRESGYFDNTADTKPLLHFWSLAIEEQFYVFWPLVLWLAFKARLNWITIAIVIAGISFCLNIKNVTVDSTATFYSFQTRIWEILVGSALAGILATKSNRSTLWLGKIDAVLERIIYAQVSATRDATFHNVASLTGVAFILIGATGNSKNIHFPGFWALLPVFGAVLLIMSGPKAWFNRKILASSFMVWVGLISFPLYLWHWPLLSFARILESQPITTVTKAIVIALSIALAWLTYVLLEKPIRRGGRQKAFWLLSCMILLGGVGYIIHGKQGLPSRGPILSSQDSGVSLSLPDVHLLNSCGMSPSDAKGFICVQDSRSPPPKYALLGDSKAEAMIGGLIKTSDDRGHWLFIGSGTAGKPVPVISEHHFYQSYQHATKLAVKAIAENRAIEKVVLVAATRILFNLANDSDIEDLAESKNYAIALAGMQAVISEFKAAKKKIILVADNPTLPHPEDCVQRITRSAWLNSLLQQTSNLRCHLSIDRHLELSKKYRQLLTELADKNKGDVFIFDITNIMCSAEKQMCETKKNGQNMYSITDHVSEYAASLIGIELNKYLSQLD